MPGSGEEGNVALVAGGDESPGFVKEPVSTDHRQRSLAWPFCERSQAGSAGTALGHAGARKAARCA